MPIADDELVALRDLLVLAARRYALPPEDAEDVVQTVLLAFVHKRDAIGSPRQWLFGALRREVLFFRRTAARRAGREVAMDPLPPAPAARPNPETVFLSTLTVEQCLDAMPPLKADLLRLRYLQEHDLETIAEALGYRRSSMKKLLTRSLCAARSILEANQ